MDYLVELKVKSGAGSDKSLFVRIHARTMDEAVEKAESAWGYDALSVGDTPGEPDVREHSKIGKYRYPVEKQITSRIGTEKI